MPQDGEHTGDGAAEVGRVQRHRDVDHGVAPRAVAAFSSVAECRRLAERWKLSGCRKMRVNGGEKQHHQHECEFRWHGEEMGESKPE